MVSVNRDAVRNQTLSPISSIWEVPGYSCASVGGGIIFQLSTTSASKRMSSADVQDISPFTTSCQDIIKKMSTGPYGENSISDSYSEFVQHYQTFKTCKQLLSGYLSGKLMYTIQSFSFMNYHQSPLPLEPPDSESLHSLVKRVIRITGESANAGRKVYLEQLQDIVRGSTAWHAGTFVKKGGDASFANLRQLELNIITKAQLVGGTITREEELTDNFPDFMEQLHLLKAAVQFWKESLPREDTFTPADVAVFDPLVVSHQPITPGPELMKWCQERQITTLYVKTSQVQQAGIDIEHQKLYLGITQFSASKIDQMCTKHSIERVPDTVETAFRNIRKQDFDRIANMILYKLHHQ